MKKNKPILDINLEYSQKKSLSKKTEKEKSKLEPIKNKWFTIQRNTPTNKNMIGIK